MKLLFTRFPLESRFGGAEVQTLSVMEGLMAHGHAVAFLGSCSTLVEECKKRNILHAEVHIGEPPVTKMGAVSFLWRKQAMQKKLEAALEQFSNLDGIVMLSLSEKLLLTPKALELGIPVYWVEHDTVGSWLTKNPWLPQLKKLSTQVTTVCVSALSKQIYVDIGFPEDRILVIPNGIDLKRFPEKIESPQSEHMHVGCVARLTKDKGVDVLIEAVRTLSNIQLSIVGDGPERARLEKLGSILHNSPFRIHTSYPNLGSFYQSLDVLVLPSREHDPFGLVAAEAMAVGVPVVVTDACGIANYLTQKQDALIVRAGSVQELAQALTTLRSTDVRKHLAERGKTTAKEQFSLQRMQEDYEHMFASGIQEAKA